MLNPETSERPARPNRLRKEMLAYVERFGRWARKLNDEDLAMVCTFMQSVEGAWQQGQAQVSTDPKAAVEAGQGLPGLGASLEDVVRDGSQGMAEVKLPDGLNIQVSDLAGDDNASD